MPTNARLLICAVLLVVSTLFGGGGSPNPVSELIVELFALAALAAWILLAPRGETPRNPVSGWLWICVAIFVAIPIVQLVPLPPALWHALPGRETEIAALQLIGEANSWRPISVAAYATFASALSLIPPVVMIFFVSRLSLGDRAKLFFVLVALGVAAALIGLAQIASGNGAELSFYSGNIGNFATGFQANRNADADVLLIAFLGLLVLVANRRGSTTLLGNLIAAGIGGFLLLSVLVTGSRAGTLLIAVALVAALLLTVRFRRPRLKVIGLAVAAAAIVAVLGLSQNARLQETWIRFSVHSGERSDLWKDTRYAIGQYWPVGSGVGTFQQVFNAAERLEVVGPAFSNRAHDEYLEFALEAGLAGIALIIALAAAIVARIAAILRNSVSGRQRSQALFAAFVCGILGLHSLVDYPMRSLAVASLGALALGLLAPVADRRGEKRVK